MDTLQPGCTVILVAINEPTAVFCYWYKGRDAIVLQMTINIVNDQRPIMRCI